MRISRRTFAPLGVLALAALLLGLAAGLPQGEAAHASPAAAPAQQGVQLSGFVKMGSGTCFPDAVLQDCGGNIVAQLKGPGGQSFFVPYYDKWVSLTGVQQTCTGGGTYVDVVTIQQQADPCGGGTATATVLATATSPGASPTPGGIVDVAARDNFFDPAQITVPVGTTVRWRNLGANQHTTTSDSGVWDSGVLNPGQEFSFTFNAQGSYPYHCNIHPGMTGLVTVTGMAGPTPTQVPPGTGNLALGKPVQASTSQSGHPPEHAVDGNPNSYWASAPGYDPYYYARNYQWIYVDLGAEYDVTRMHMVWTPLRHARGYSVYVWNQYACGGWCRLASTSYGDGDDTLTASQPITGRYWLLWLQNPYYIGSHYELREWEIFGTGSTPPLSTNVAAGQPAYALNAQPGFEAGLATDTIDATEWRPAALPAWIYVDLGRTVDVNRVTLKWAVGAYASQYALYAWNGYSWVGLYSTTSGNGDTDDISFYPVNTRYMLLYAVGSPTGNVGLREFEVYQRSGGGGFPYPFLRDLPQDWRAAPGGVQPEVVPEGAAPTGLRDLGGTANGPRRFGVAPSDDAVELRLERLGFDPDALPDLRLEREAGE
jgi:plastocyanin